MLFIANKPTHLLITHSRQVILTTPNQLILTQLEFIEEYLATSLAYTHPILLAHSSSSSETLVATKSSLQLFWTDWQQKLDLLLLISLNQETVNSIDYQLSWFAYGNFRQYGSKKLNLYKTDNIDQSLLSCYIGSKQFIVSNTKLILYQHRNHTRRYLQWPSSKKYITKIHQQKPTLKACRVHQENYLIQAGNLMIYLNSTEILHCMEYEGELVISGKTAVWFNIGKMKIFQVEKSQIHDLGEVSSFDGYYFGSIIENSKICMLFYDFQELMVKTINLVSQQTNIQYQKKQQQKSRLRNQTLEIKPSESSQSLANLIDQLSDEKNKSQSNSISKHNMSKNSIQKALKESILKFQEQFNRSQCQQQKFNEEAKQNEANSNYHELIIQIKAQKAQQMVRGDSLQQNKENLEQQNSKNTVFNEGKSKFESINGQIVDIHQHSSNINLHDCAETPGFQHLQHNFNDNWGSLANAWPSTSKIQVINEIKQEVDFEGQQRKESQIQLDLQKLNQSSCMEIIIVEEELNSPRVVKSPQQSRKSEEPEVSDFKLAEHSKQFKGFDTLLTDTNALKNSLNNFIMAQKPVQGKRPILNSCIFAKSAIQEASNQPKQMEPEKNKVQTFKIRRSFPGKMLSVQTPAYNKDGNVPSSPLLKKYTFNPNIQSENYSAVNDEGKPKFVNWLSDDRYHKKKATQILREIFKRQPQTFEEALQNLFHRVITEPEASLFFTQYIRIFNPNSTKDRLLRLYRHIEDNQQNKILMTKALKEFKLEEVPTICLSFNKNLIGIFRAIYHEVYIQDLLSPSIELYEAMLQSYFSQKFERISIKIQDEIIALAYPRNLLNVLLFLNEHFNLKIEQVFMAFTKKMLKYQQDEIVKKIMHSDIPIICKIDVSLFSKAAQSVAKEILQQNSNSYPKIQNIIEMMDYKSQKIFRLTINLIQQFNLSGIIFNIHQILELPYSNTTYNILKDLIKCNCAESLVKINLPEVIKILFWLEKGKKEHYYTQEGIDITKLYVKKLLENKFYVEGIVSLIPISAGLKRSYLAAILIIYFGGRFANRLSNLIINTQVDFVKVFNDLLNKTEAKGDSMPQNVANHANYMKWSQFYQVCMEKLNLESWELCYLVYNDHQLAYQLIEESVLTQSQLNQLFKILGIDTSKYKFVKFFDKKSKLFQIPLGSQSSQDSQSEDIRLATQDKWPKKKSKFELSFKVIKSMDYAQKSNQKLCRSLLEHDQETDPVLFDLKFTVTSQESVKILREHYERSSIQQFFQALKLIDKQQLGILPQNVDILKAVYNLNIDLPIKELIPFEYLFSSEQAWLLVKSYIRKEVYYDSFWAYFLLVEIVYDKAAQIVEFFVQRLINDSKDDWSSVLVSIFQQVTLPKQFMQEKSKKAEKRGLINLTNALRSQ